MASPNVLDALAEALAPALSRYHAKTYGIGFKHDASGTPISVGYSHGPGGNLSFPGVDPVLFHTTVGNRGILGQLPTMASRFTNPTYYTITGVQADTGSEKSEVCDNAPTAGLMKACLVTSVFGRYERATGELELNRLGQLNDRADPMDLALVGSPIHQSGIFAAGALNPETPGDLFQNEVSRKFWERNVSFHRLLSRQLWIGSPANNAAGGGYKEMTGFDVLINTGYVDAENNQSCPSLDSDLKNFSYARIDSNCDALVDALASMYRFVKELAERTGVMPVRWVFAMRSQLFHEITACWPCSYLTYRCQVSGNEQVQIQGAEQIRMRDEMRAGRYLLLEGERIEVIIDDGIAEDTNTINGSVPSGCFGSDIYLIPMSVVGGRAVTYLEYFDYTNPSLASALSNLVLARVEGAFLTWIRQANQCVVWQSKVEPRLVIRTPWLAGRLQNVVYCPTQHDRDAFPSDPYFVDGGRTSRPGPSYYSIWNAA